jgi:histidinol-phosphate aminotransferase
VQRELSKVVSALHRYPVGQEDTIIESLSRRWKLPSDRIMLTRGIDEATDRLIEEFANRRFRVIVPGFDAFPHRLNVKQRRHRTIRLDPSFKNISDQSIATLSEDTFVFLANPNNPTGVSLSQPSLRAVMESGTGLLIDETYFEFQDEASQLPATGERFVYRSLSKCFSLAGLRLGVLIGPAAAIGSMRSRQWFCNIDAFALRAFELLFHSDLPDLLAKTIIEERERLTIEIADVGFHVKKTVTNFLLVEHPAADSLASFLRADGIVVRLTDSMGLPNHIRISIGRPTENRRVVANLKRFRRQS